MQAPPNSGILSGLWATLGPYLRRAPGQLVALLLLVLGGIAVQLVNPQIIRNFIDAAQNQTSPAVLLGAAGIYMALALVQQAFIVATTWLGERLSWRTTNALREDLALHCLRLDMAFHKQTSPGELIERIDGDVDALGRFIAQFFVQLGSTLLLVIGILVMLWLEDWRFGLAVTVVALLAAIYLQWLRPVATRRWEVVRARSAAFYGFLEERLNGLPDIRPNGAAAYTLRQMQLRLRDIFLATRHAEIANAGIVIVPNMSFGLAIAATYLLGGTLFANSAVTLGGIYLVFSYVDLLNDQTWRLIDQITALQRSQASIGRVRALLAVESRLVDSGRAALPPGAPDVQLQQLTFQYADGDAPVLQDVSLHLPAGQVLGLLGRTGSGKSTLISLIFRLYDATDGALRIGGVDVRDLPLATLRSTIGMVTQQVELFRATLRDNLTLFDASVGDDQLIEALTMLGLADWLAALPDGLDTVLTSGGGDLSAGQAQLIAFARVFLRDPRLVILDEASSRLDPVSEQLLERALTRLLAGRTAIIIAHRLTTVERADQIAILDHGRLIEYGARAALLANPDATYTRLLRAGSAAELLT